MINSFRDENFYLSNFYNAPVTFEGFTYQNNEACFQAQKTLDLNIRKQFTSLNPSEAKKMGRSIPLRKDWEDIKVSIMKEIVYQKFCQNKDLQDKLLSTNDDYLEEGNDWGDKIWGTVNGQGANLLGQILMEVREELRNHTLGFIEDEFENIR